LATEIALILQGKKSAAYDPSKVGDDRVFVKNCHLVTIGGKKSIDKIYYHHTGYMGHLKEKSFEQVFAKNPKKVVEEAVRRMLPKNFLNQRRMRKLMFIEDAAN
jgi:large subunit ribosomal protein L13